MQSLRNLMITFVYVHQSSVLLGLLMEQYQVIFFLSPYSQRIILVCYNRLEFN